MRVKRINLPFAELVENEEPEHTDTMDSFKPLDTHHGNGMRDSIFYCVYLHTKTWFTGKLFLQKYTFPRLIIFVNSI